MDMKTIWKWELEIKDEQIITLPVGREFLSVQEQQGSLVIWYRVEPMAEKQDILFRVVGTGQPLHEHPGTYRGSVQFRGGALVWHVFEELL